MSKEKTYRFLVNLRGFLNSKMPYREIVRREVAEAVRVAKASNQRRDKHSSFPEGAFLNKYIIQNVHEFLISELNLKPDEARQALLSESWASSRQYVSSSPVRTGPHPFRKELFGRSVKEVMGTWRGKSPVTLRSCPDLALRSPSPHRIVFEGKYHTSSSLAGAERDLVTNIYQAFFYLGLPRRTETKKNAAWDYEYACVLAYDATDEGSLVQAWDSLPEKVKVACWEGANLFVMVLGDSSPT